MLGSMFKLFKQVNVDIVQGLEKEDDAPSEVRDAFDVRFGLPP